MIALKQLNQSVLVRMKGKHVKLQKEKIMSALNLHHAIVQPKWTNKFHKQVVNTGNNPDQHLEILKKL